MAAAYAVLVSCMSRPWPSSTQFFFPRGEDGWHPAIPLARVPVAAVQQHQESSEDEETHIDPGTRHREKVTMAAFYAYRLQYRATDGIALLRGGRLLQQYIVDAYAAIEQSRLNYFLQNQKTLRADLYQYQCLQDAVGSVTMLTCHRSWHNRYFRKHPLLLGTKQTERRPTFFQEARNYTSADFPKYFVWNVQGKR
ncbi:hypothetical protein PsorP6_011330 [Peronosclerospora sorghi]|uniref:Uncharacterized protein n=1 Tax=Peronosclerospora sorghi TaxID=230839 RepID=A0ACC0WKU4_9STRA|nr:hypothetical protein PsorP6_011330 [Peronosclerospora sorghi]